MILSVSHRRLSISEAALAACRIGVRRGAVTLEAILVIPVLILVVMACFEYGVAMLATEGFRAAVTEGAREGAKVPTTIAAVDGVRVINAVKATVEPMLNTQGIAPANIQVIVQDSSGVASSGPAVGPVPGVTTVIDPAVVLVTVRVQFTNTKIPNLLATFFVDLSTRKFDVSSISRRDVP